MASGEAKKRRTPAAEVDGLTFSRVAVAPVRAAQTQIRLDRIIVGERLRAADPEAVAALAVSMDESGQEAPVTVRPYGSDAQGQLYKLVTGGHRYDAATLLGWPIIDAIIRDLTDAQALLVEIDENLIRRELSPYERAVFIEARLKAWAEVHPDRVSGNSVNMTELAPKRGRPKNSDKMSEFLGDTPPTMGFAAETAADLGVDEKTVRRALAVARGLSAPVHAKIRGSKLGRNEGLLRQLAGVANPVEQLRTVEALLDGDAKNFAQALHIASGREPVQAPPRPVDETVAAFRKLWKAAKPTHRDALLNFLQGQALPAGWALTKGGAE